MWTATGSDGSTANVGLISASGLYIAPGTPPSPSIVNIKGTSVADTTKSASATVNVLVHHINQDPQQTPIKLGTSGGNGTDSRTTTDPAGKSETFCCSGTLGALVSRGSAFYILSNNHVLDKSDQGIPGQPILQPGLADTNCGQQQSTLVANFTQAAPLRTSNVDAALARIVDGAVDPSGAILDLEGPDKPATPPSTILATPTVNQIVAKSGDATGLTCASITAINFRVTVNYQTECSGGDPFNVTFTNQISITDPSFSNNGDSGSLIVTADNARPVALLYAGGRNGSVGTPIADVLTALKDPNSSEVPKLVGAGDHAVPCAASPQSAAAQSREEVAPLSKEQTYRANSVVQRRGAELMQDSAISDLRVGRSDDDAKAAAILVFLRARPHLPIPPQIDGLRTKIISGSVTRGQSSDTTHAFNGLPTISDSEIVRAEAVNERRAEAMMSNPVILGVGVGASQDSPGESALVVFVEKGKQVTVPAEIDGVRTRIIETDRFRTFNWGKRTRNSCSKR